MTLVDTGPLIALVNRDDPNYAVCRAAAGRLPLGPLVTSWPCFTEAMYMVFRAGGYPAQVALWTLRTAGRLIIHDLTAAEIDRMMTLMDKYRDTPMDLADASLVATAESLGQRAILTLDSHFRVYRLADGSTFEVVP